MRIPLLEKVAPEEGSYTIKLTFKDEGKELNTPTSLYWWLTDLTGLVINGRSEVEVVTITNPHYLTLQGDDLQLHKVTDTSDYRYVTLKGTYNSDRGNNLPFTKVVMFQIENILLIAKPLDVEVVDTVYLGDVLTCSSPV